MATIGLVMIVVYLREPKDFMGTKDKLTSNSSYQSINSMSSSNLDIEKTEANQPLLLQESGKKNYSSTSSSLNNNIESELELDLSKNSSILNTDEFPNGYSSPYYHPMAVIVGFLGSFLSSCTFSAFAVLHPLLLMDPAWGVVKHSTRDNITDADAQKVSLTLGRLILPIIIYYIF